MIYWIILKYCSLEKGENIMKKVLKGWLDLDLLQCDNQSNICESHDDIGRHGLELEETLLGQIQEFDGKKIKIIIEVIE
jgi:hypothetical protein